MVFKKYQSYGDKGVYETMLEMKKLILDSDKDRIVKEVAKDIIIDIDPRDEITQIEALLKFVRNNVKYVKDIYGVEELTSPDRLLRSLKNNINNFSSDCDDMAMLLSALLRVVGFKTRIEVISIKGRAYDHARVSVFSKTLNKWLPLEATSKTMRVGEGFKSKKKILAIDII